LTLSNSILQSSGLIKRFEMITMCMLVAALVAVASGGECPDTGKRITLLEWQRNGEIVKPILQQEALTALKVKSFSICAFLEFRHKLTLVRDRARMAESNLLPFACT
jgi:hypothetical protein